MILPSLATVWRGAMLAIGLAAAVPVRSGDIAAHPRPSRNYADAVVRAQSSRAKDSAIVAPGGETILRTHGAPSARVVILFHGFTDSPRQFEALADSLFQSGDNVLVPRLPHHGERGKDARELARLTAGELCRTADSAVDIAAGLGDSVVVVGLSVGGTMAAWAVEHRSEVRRAVVIAPPFEVAHVPSVLERPLVNLGAHAPNVSRRSAIDSERPDRDPGFATHGLAQVLRLGMAVRSDAPRLVPMRADVLFLVNAHDGTVKTPPVLDLARVWNARGASVRVFELPDSLGLEHNIVDPRNAKPDVGVVYPTLIALAHGERPPRAVTPRR